MKPEGFRFLYDIEKERKLGKIQGALRQAISPLLIDSGSEKIVGLPKCIVSDGQGRITSRRVLAWWKIRQAYDVDEFH